MDREKLCILITGVLCVLGCVFISVFNFLEGNYVKAELIPRSDYNVGIAVSSGLEEAGCSSTQSESDTININTASAAQLAEFLPGIGEKKAADIVEYREQAGKFVTVDELIKVNGIGEKTLERIRPYCRVSD